MALHQLDMLTNWPLHGTAVSQLCFLFCEMCVCVVFFWAVLSCLQIQGLEKISKQLANEVPKIRKDLQLANEKEMQLGKKSLDQTHKQHELAKSMMKKKS